MKARTLLHGLGARQRGSVLVNVAAGLSMMIVLLGSIDLGLLYFYKREYQKAADLAAIAGARQLPAGCDQAVSAGTDSANINLDQQAHDTPVVQCGVWSPTAAPRFTAAIDDANAIRALILGVVPTLFPGTRNLSAEAIAISSTRGAALNLRSTLVNVDTSQSAALNALFGGLLDGNVSLSAVGWNGLLNTDISLLEFLDQLAIDIGVQAGGYDDLLASEVSVGEILDAGIGLLMRGDGTGEITAALGGLESLRLAIPPGTPLIELGDLIAVQSGTPTEALDVGLDLFQLVQGSVQAANSRNFVAANLGLAGIADVDVRVIEPPQISAVGDPELARLDPDGPNRIYVRTAQVRTLISVNLPALGGITNLLNSVLGLLSPVTTLLNDVLNLDLVSALNGLLGSLLGIPYEVTDIQLVPGNPRIDISLDVGGGEAKVTDYNCPAPGEKSLDTDIETSVANLRIGRMEIDPGEPGWVFGSDAPPSVEPVPLVDVGVKRCTVFLLLLSSCEARRPFEGGGIGILAQTTVAGTPYTNTFIDPPDLDEPPDYETFEAQNIVDSLASTLGGIELEFFGPDGSGGLGGVLNLVVVVFDTVKGILQPLINGLLSPLLDPLVNLLLETLGLDLAQLEVGARLTCGGDAALVE